VKWSGSRKVCILASVVASHTWMALSNPPLESRAHPDSMRLHMLSNYGLPGIIGAPGHIVKRECVALDDTRTLSALHIPHS
jgi:hypothetical protein